MCEVSKRTMYQRKVDVDMLNAVKSVLADVPHQRFVDTLYVLPPRRRRPKLVLTGTSIPLKSQKFDW